MRIGIFILLSLLLYSCSKTSETEQYAKLVEQWQGKEIIIPTDLKGLVQGVSIDYNINDCDYKILTYIDSIGCSTCKLNFAGWEQLMNEISLNQDLTVKLMLMINPTDASDIIKMATQYKFNYPIIIDETNLIDSLNNFSSGIKFQTLLLDEENKVMLIGDPLHNDKIKNLYRNLLDIDQSIQAQKLDSNIVGIPAHLAMGVFKPSEEKASKFLLKNKTNNSVVISNIYTSCSCTSAWTNQDTIPPNDNINLYVSCRPNEHDKSFVRYINVELNTKERINLSISGFISEN